MSTRDGKSLSIAYVHVSLGHAKFSNALAALKTMHEAKGDFVLSVNENDAGTEAIIKVAGASAKTLLSGKAWAGAVLEVFPQKRHDEVRKIVTDPTWIKEQ